MMKHCVRTLVVTLLLSCSTALAFAQTDTPKVEVGAQFTYLRLRDIPVPSGFQGAGENDPGIGLRVGYNITNSLAAEAEFNYFARDLNVPSLTGGGGVTNVTYSTSRTQGLFGVKYLPLRGDKFGIGGKVRPGFVKFNGSGGAIPPSPTILGQIAGGYNSFAMDIGGVFEYYPSRHFVARMDLGDTIIRVKGVDPSLSVNGFTSNNIQLTVGFGFRF
jgi:outer membrane protein with beta-barrel domain